MYKVPKTEPLKLIEIKEKYLLAITNVCMLAQNKEHKKKLAVSLFPYRKPLLKVRRW